jgi:hypothetical protein
MSDIYVPAGYLFDCSVGALESVLLSRLNRVAALRREFRHLTDQWIKLEVDARLATRILVDRRICDHADKEEIGSLGLRLRAASETENSVLWFSGRHGPSESTWRVDPAMYRNSARAGPQFAAEPTRRDPSDGCEASTVNSRPISSMDIRIRCSIGASPEIRHFSRNDSQHCQCLGWRLSCGITRRIINSQSYAIDRVRNLLGGSGTVAKALGSMIEVRCDTPSHVGQYAEG